MLAYSLAAGASAIAAGTTADADIVYSGLQNFAIGQFGSQNLNLDGATTGGGLEGDLDGDGFIGVADLNVVLGKWNTGTPPADIAALIPEPGSVSVLIVCGLGLLRRGGSLSVADRR